MVKDESDLFRRFEKLNTQMIEVNRELAAVKVRICDHMMYRELRGSWQTKVCNNYTSIASPHKASNLCCCYYIFFWFLLF